MGVEMFDTRGMQALLEYIKAHGPRTDAEWAEMFDISRTHFLGIRTGTAQPSKKVIERIAHVTEGAVPVTAWFAPAVQQGTAA